MPRKRRHCPGGLAYHVFNRATARERIFDDAADYLAFERVLAEARERLAGQLRLCCYAIMPNHFHLVLWPKTDEALTRFMQWLTLTHAQRWHAHRHSAGTGALYGSRFKSFPIREDEHFLKVCRYVERNPLRAGLVKRVENWQWGSFYKRDPRCTHKPGAAELLDDWPVSRPRNWKRLVHQPQSDAELEALEMKRGRGPKRHLDLDFQPDMLLFHASQTSAVSRRPRLPRLQPRHRAGADLR